MIRIFIHTIYKKCVFNGWNLSIFPVGEGEYHWKVFFCYNSPTYNIKYKIFLFFFFFQTTIIKLYDNNVSLVVIRETLKWLTWIRSRAACYCVSFFQIGFWIFILSFFWGCCFCCWLGFWGCIGLYFDLFIGLLKGVYMVYGVMLKISFWVDEFFFKVFLFYVLVVKWNLKVLESCWRIYMWI